MSLSQQLKALRAAHHMTQDELAKRMNLARTTIAGYETKSRQPSHEKLTAMADIFGVSVDYLLDAKDESSCTELSLTQERLLDQKVFTLYHQLSLKSKKDAYEYLRLLEMREHNQEADSD